MPPTNTPNMRPVIGVNLSIMGISYTLSCALICLFQLAVDSTGTKPYYEEDLTGAIVFCFGGEDRGVPPC